MADVGLPHAAIREQVASAIDLVVHQRRMPTARARSRRSPRWCARRRPRCAGVLCAWTRLPRRRAFRADPAAARPGGDEPGGLAFAAARRAAARAGDFWPARRRCVRARRAAAPGRADSGSRARRSRGSESGRGGAAPAALRAAGAARRRLAALRAPGWASSPRSAVRRSRSQRSGRGGAATPARWVRGRPARRARARRRAVAAGHSVRGAIAVAARGDRRPGRQRAAVGRPRARPGRSPPTMRSRACDAGSDRLRST